MPGPWLAISAAILFTPHRGVSASIQAAVKQTYGDLVVEAKSATFTEDVVTFRDGVKATFSGEVLTADSLVLRPKDQTGEAAGHVLLLDPAGTLSADDLKFSWKAKGKGENIGSASKIHLDLAGVVMDAEKAETIPGDPPTIVFTNVVGTSCGREKPPVYLIHAPKIEFHPGKEGIIRHPILYLFGKRILTLPSQRFSLDPRIHGIPLPGITYSKDKVGLVWAPSILIDRQTALDVNVKSLKGEIFTGNAYASRSYLSADSATSLIQPHSDLAERFGSSYFDNIKVETPLSGAKSLRSRRDTLAIGTSWNSRSINDPSHSIYSKMLEGVYEMGGPIGDDWGYQYSFRLQDIRRNDEPFHGRAVGQGSIGPSPRRLGQNLLLVPRLDAAAYMGTTTFGWARAEAGIAFNPKKWFTLGVGYGHGEEFGTPMFPADKLLIRDEGMARLDLDFGPTKMSILERRDFDRDRWYREYKASQVMGCMEAFVVARQFPRSYRLGLTLRLDVLIKNKTHIIGT